jgi:hypothetical protein
MQWSTFWTAVGALATVAAVFTILFAGRQLRFDVWVKAQEIFVGGSFVRARTRVFRHLKQPDLNWDADDQEAGMEVCRRMDEVCRFAPYFSFTRSRGQKAFLDAWGDPLGKSWALLEPLVKAERDFVGWQKKWNAFQQLGSIALNQLPQEIHEELETIATRLSPQVIRLRCQPLKAATPGVAAEQLVGPERG